MTGANVQADFPARFAQQYVVAGEPCVRFNSRIPGGGGWNVPITATKSSFEHMVVVREAANIIKYCQGEHFISLLKDGSLEAQEYPWQPRGLAKKPAPRVENATWTATTNTSLLLAAGASNPQLRIGAQSPSPWCRLQGLTAAEAEATHPTFAALLKAASVCVAFTWTDIAATLMLGSRRPGPSILRGFNTSTGVPVKLTTSSYGMGGPFYTPLFNKVGGDSVGDSGGGDGGGDGAETAVEMAVETEA
jgi:hypothetical protein